MSSRRLSHETHWSVHDFALNVHSSDLDDRDVQVSFIAGDLSFNADFGLLELMELRDVLTDSIGELFTKDESIQCPACGYTQWDADLHKDHKTCRRFPFFPEERGETEAINK